MNEHTYICRHVYKSRQINERPRSVFNKKAINSSILNQKTALQVFTLP